MIHILIKGSSIVQQIIIEKLVGRSFSVGVRSYEAAAKVLTQEVITCDVKTNKQKKNCQ